MSDGWRLIVHVVGAPMPRKVNPSGVITEYASWSGRGCFLNHRMAGA